MSALPKCLSSVRFGSFLVYSSHGETETSEESRGVVRRIKNGHLIDKIIDRLRQEIDASRSASVLMDILGEDVLVVPCPRSAPFHAGNVLWPSKTICDELVRHHLAMRTAPILERKRAVQKSSMAPSKERAKPSTHFESMDISEQLELPPSRITVVDDVVTRGATLIAGVSRVKHQFPSSQVCGFGLVRTLSDGEIMKMTAPVIGKIELRGVDAFRSP
jgi:hypothetical protein